MCSSTLLAVESAFVHLSAWLKGPEVVEDYRRTVPVSCCLMSIVVLTRRNSLHSS